MYIKSLISPPFFTYFTSSILSFRIISPIFEFLHVRPMIHDEQLLQYLWKYKLYPSGSLITTDHRVIEVIDPGMQNRDAGPDFFNAKVKMGGQLWAGNVEIHCSSDDWIAHRHHQDKAYNSVILHAAEKVTREVVNQAGQRVPQCRLIVPGSFRESTRFLLHSDGNLPCRYQLHTLPKAKVRSFLSRLATERLERKTNDIQALLKRFNNSWDEVFHVMMARNFGFGVNADAFERLALSLPYKYLLKHGDEITSVEALLFGQAGLLDEEVKGDTYQAALRQEYLFLKRKYSLKGLEGYLFKRLRVRPRSFPELRLAQLASLLQSSGRLFSAILQETDCRRLIARLQTEPSPYWQTHYAFGEKSTATPKKIGTASLEIIAINTIIPVLFAYGKSISDDALLERALRFLETLKPEKNARVREFEKAGIVPENAADTQALIQLGKEYCDKRECLFCQIGHALLSTR